MSHKQAKRARIAARRAAKLAPVAPSNGGNWCGCEECHPELHYGPDPAPLGAPFDGEPLKDARLAWGDVAATRAAFAVAAILGIIAALLALWPTLPWDAPPEPFHAPAKAQEAGRQ